MSRAAALLLLPAAGCIAPPALLDPMQFEPQALERMYPPGFERVAVPVGDDGERLHGVFVPADPGAPVVLQLLEASISVASDGLGYGSLAREMADLGLATLVLDWRGIGLSDGDASVDHVAADARAMWAEAVRRAGGDPRRVVLRGTSLGTIAAAQLLADGVEPGALVLVAPVRSASATRRFAWEMYGLPTGLIAGAVFRPIAGVDPVEELSRTRAPALVAPGTRDFFLEEEDLEEIRAAAARSGARVLPLARNHVFAALAGHHVLRPDEEALLGGAGLVQPDVLWRVELVLARLDPEVAARLPAGSPERERFASIVARMVHTPASWLAAAALAGWRIEETEGLLRSARGEPRLWAALAFDDLVAEFDLSDPAGALDPAEILDWSDQLPAAGGPTAHGCVGVLSSLEAARAGLDGPEGARGTRLTSRSATGRGSASFWMPLAPLWTSIQARGAGRADAERLFLRTLLKAWRQHADRVVPGPDGAPRLEVRVDGVWVPFAEAAAEDARRLAQLEAEDAPAQRAEESGRTWTIRLDE